ncbi:MAG: hypothetical protein Q7R76_06475 [Candidatus Woesearchaeota archaeon]|nr:hypothetical protein [Candidatus Woesearchaeota archaeon]
MKTHTNLKIFFLYLLIASIATYPLILKLEEPLGVNPQDNLSFMWNFWWMKKVFTEGKNPLYTDALFYPTGINMAFTDMTFFNSIIGMVIGEATDYVTAFNLIAFLTCVFGAFTMYLLLVYLLKNRYAAFFGGYIYAFGPWHIYKINSSLIWASIEFVPLFLLFLFKTTEEPTKKNALLMGLFLALTFYTSIPFAFVMVLFSLIYTAWLLVTKKATKKLAACLGLGALLFTALVSPIVISMIIARGEYIATTNPGQDLSMYSVRTSAHLIATGVHTKTVIGVTTIILGLAGSLLLFKKKKGEAVLWLSSLLIFFVLNLGDQGIKVGKQIYAENLLMPAYFLRQLPLLNSFDFTKTVFVVVLITSILAGYGCVPLVEFLRKNTDRKSFAAGIMLLFFIIAADITTAVVPSDKELFSEKRNDAYKILAQRGTPDDVVMNLPIPWWVNKTAVIKPELISVRNMMGQTVFNKKIMSGYRSRISDGLIQRARLLYLTDPEKIKDTSRFVVIYKSYVFPTKSSNSAFSCDIPLDPKGKEFIDKVMVRFARAKIYEDHAFIIYDLAEDEEEQRGQNDEQYEHKKT